MKKILALVLIMAVSTMAVTFTGSYNAVTGKVTIAYDAPIVGMALDVDATGVSATAVTLPAFFDVFMDYAYTQGASYVYGAGNAIANQDAAGVATLPSSAFCISAGGLEDPVAQGQPADEVPATGSIEIAVTGTSGSVVISANTLRGGVVDYNGAMTTNLPITVQIQNVPSVCRGDVDADGWITLDDVYALVVYLNAYEADGFFTEVTPATAAYDYDNDGWVTLDDVYALVVFLNGYAADGYFTECAN